MVEPAPDDVFEQAEACELAGDLDGAERWYRIATHIDRTDPVAPFNLGNVLDSLISNRPQEAAFAYDQAVDPRFAEAWVNLGALRERKGAVDAARARSSSPICGESTRRCFRRA